MKKIVLLLIFTLMLAATLALTSCNNNSSETEVESLSAYDVLNDDEKIVYSALEKFASDLNDPTSLKLIDLKVGKTSANGTTEKVFVKVSASNAFGSPVTDVYVIDYGCLSTGGSAWYSVAGAWYHSGSVSKINAALQEYFDSMEW